MREQTIFNDVITVWFILALIVFAILFFIPAPYGRHTRKSRRSIPDSWGWLLMESPAVFVFGGMFLIGSYHDITAIVFLLLWLSHYIHRAFIYPFLHRKSSKRMPWIVVVMGFLFNTMNGYLNGYYLFQLSGGYPRAWMKDGRFWIGSVLFVVGYVVNRTSDSVLHKLRETNHGQYGIPQGGLYRWVSCPNYLGEITLWIGWAIATWSAAGAVFAAWTIANLAPRAWMHHKWYREHFADYPPRRKALLPGIW